jgi:enoyl-CoA hydratase/carnithine racemase
MSSFKGNSMQEQGVIFQTLSTQSQAKIGYASLNKPSALNTLDLQMIRSLLAALELWQADSNVVMVLIDGVGDKAFCAGGDIVAMYHDMQDSNSSADENVLQEFFTKEYELDYLLHTYIKPVLVWGNGLVMGGGLGLMSGASHKVVTESARLAMPEISIGLYPDAGGSYFLNKLACGLGMFLGLTGASLQAADALYVNLADYYIRHDSKSILLKKLQGANWAERSAGELLTSICQSLEITQHRLKLSSKLIANDKWFTQLAEKSTVNEAVAFVLDASTEFSGPSVSPDKWLQKAQVSLQKGSSLSAHLIFEQLKRGKNMNLLDCLKMELTLSCKCAQYGEFQEGVRALLIDKDHQPDWRFKTISDVPLSQVTPFFESIWSNVSHPLGALALNQIHNP